MLAGQTVVFVTDETRRFLGRSPSVEDFVAEEMLQSAPSPSDLIERNSDSLKFHRPADDRIAISRTVFSEQEISSCETEGALTYSTIIETEQLSGFDYNPALFAFVAQSEGALFFHGPKISSMEDIELADSTILKADKCGLASQSNVAAKIERAIEIHRCVAITGVQDSLMFLAGYLAEVSLEKRMETTFSIGSLFSEARSSQLLLYPDVSDRIKRKLVGSQIRTMTQTDLTASD